jgi:hypothetical protein
MRGGNDTIMIAGRPHYTLARRDEWNILGDDFFDIHQASVERDDLRGRVRLDLPYYYLLSLEQQSNEMAHI